MLKRFAILGLTVALAAVALTPIYATPMQGAVRQVSTADAAALGGSVGCRYYQVTGAFPGINPTTGATTPACLDNRCARVFNTNAIFGGAGFGGYNCNQEFTEGYAPPAGEPSNQTYYNLVDAQANGGTCDHIAYYVVEGQSANNVTTDNVGDARASNCAGSVAQNCFTAGDAINSDQTPLTSTSSTFGSTPHQIRSIGGLSPVPTARVTVAGGGGCAAGQVRVTWDDPIDASQTMKNGVPSPVQGVNLYSNPASCGSCPNGETGWVSVGQFGATAGAAGTCVPVAGSSWFALTVRLKGPGNGPTTIETGRVAGVGFVGANSQCVDTTGTVARIVSLSARYAGRGTVNVNWTSGSEGGVSGFYVTRATTPAGPYARVSDLVGGTGDNSRYTFADHIRAGVGRLVYYQLQIQHADGTTELSGTTAVTMPTPKAKKLGDN